MNAGGTQRNGGRSRRRAGRRNRSSHAVNQSIATSLKIVAAATSIVAVVLLVGVLYQLRDIARPFAIAVFLTYIVHPLVAWLVRRRCPRAVAYALALSVVLAVLYGIGQLAVLNARGFAANLPRYQQNLARYADQLVALAQRYKLIEPGELRAEAWRRLVPTQWIASIVGEGTSAFFGFVSNLLVVLFFALFILLEAERVPERIRRAWPAARAQRVLDALADINTNVQRYLLVKVLVSAVTAVAALLVMMAFGLDFFALWAVLVFVFNFVPYVGSVLATALPGLLALVQFESPMTALWLAVLLTSIQMLIGNVLEPQLQGRRLNLSPLLILVALAFWGWLWGIVGMVLAIPIAVTLRIAMERVPALRPLAVMMSNDPLEQRSSPASGVDDDTGERA